MNITSLDSLRNRIKDMHPRTRKAQINTLFSLLLKGSGLLISLLLVPLTIDYLSKDTYGTWLTISSIVTMIALFDIGIGNGLRNKLTEAVSRQDYTLARAYVSTAYLIFGMLQLTFIGLFLIAFRFIPWQRILNTTIDNGQLQSVVLMTMVAIAIKLVLDILSYILFALQESSLVGFINFLSNVLILLGTYTLTRFSSGNLIYLGAVTVSSPIIVLLFSGSTLYKNKLKLYKPSLKMADLKYAKSLLSLGYKFFIIQMAVIVLFYTDTLIIAQFFGPADVTTYNVCFKYFNSVNTIFTIVIAPYWSSFTDAYAKNDYEWMKRTHIYLQRVWVLFVAIIVVMVFMSEHVYHLWVGGRVAVPKQLSMCMGIFVIIGCWNSVNVVVANGLGKIKLQLIYALIAACINIPLSIYFIKGLKMGSSGVVLATSIALLLGSVLGNIQAKKLLFKTAKGIWNK